MQQHSDTSGKELVSFRFEKMLKQQLAQLSAATGRSQTFLVEEAVRQYCDLHSWQVSAINEGIAAADQGQLVPHDAIKRKWMTRRDDSLDQTR